MSDDWKIGDLAMLIRWREHWRVHGMRPGLVSRVIAVFPEDEDDWEALLLDGLPKPVDGSKGYTAAHFIKVTPKAPDAEDAEVIALLNGAGVKEASDA